ncbi:MAG: hypothetical protein QM774_03350 [Gordonia sp. (in: high G+C Gram-positive bacteria)]|uniref:hypothetical protein n=1 Tax=Gordonia sp. (in: high G+C Gram-positive bacteria) TaxID=84139 RepID=UPI0039E667F3
MLKKTATILVATGLAASIAACSSHDEAKDEPVGGNVIAPVTMSVGDLPGRTVGLKVGQVLNINVDRPVDAYRGDVADTAVATFTAGRVDQTATFNPGINAVAPGSTAVTLSADGIAPIAFTVTVTPR